MTDLAQMQHVAWPYTKDLCALRTEGSCQIRNTQPRGQRLAGYELVNVLILVVIELVKQRKYRYQAGNSMLR